MSGPKYSTAVIREVQRLQRLKAKMEREIEEGKRKQAIDSINKLEKERNKLCCDPCLTKIISNMDKADGIIPDSDILVKLRELLQIIDSEKDKEFDKSGDSRQLSTKCDVYGREITRIKNTIQLMKQLSHELSEQATKKIEDDKEKAFWSIEWEDTGIRIDTVQEDIRQMYYELLDLMAEDGDYDEEKAILDNSVMKTGDAAYKKHQLKLRKDAIMVERNARSNHSLILELTNEWISLSRLVGGEAKEIPTEEPVLKSQINEMRDRLEKRRASEYISECVHKVFEEKGYELLDDVMVETKQGKIQKDYYEFGEDSLVNVSMSEHGQMLFEVVGDGEESQMDSRKAESLESEMRRFCPNYGDIKSALEKEYGISLEDEHLCEPDKKYAKMSGRNSNRSKRRKKTEKKMMSDD